MITRLILKLPWFLSAPTIVGLAVAAAVGSYLVAGAYFQRSFLDDADPLAGLTLNPPAPVMVATVPIGAGSPSAAVTIGVAASPSPSPSASPAAMVAPTAPPPAAASPSPSPSTSPAAMASASAPPPVADPGVLRQGQFVDGDPGHNGKGRARLLRTPDRRLVLRLESFSVTNGPDLFLILSTDPRGSRSSATAADAVNLGRLKATDGNANYDVPADLDPDRYRSVIIYCRAFKIVFAIAALEAAS